VLHRFPAVGSKHKTLSISQSITDINISIWNLFAADIQSQHLYCIFLGFYVCNLYVTWWLWRNKWQTMQTSGNSPSQDWVVSLISSRLAAAVGLQLPAQEVPTSYIALFPHHTLCTKYQKHTAKSTHLHVTTFTQTTNNLMHLSLEKTCVHKMFIIPSKISVPLLICIQSLLENTVCIQSEMLS